METVMKTIRPIIVPMLIVAVSLCIQFPAAAQQGQNSDKPEVEQQSGKTFLLQFHNPEPVDIQHAKQQSWIRLDDPLSGEKLRGGAIRFHTDSDGTHYLEILHPDSAKALREQAFDMFDRKARAAPPKTDRLDGFRGFHNHATVAKEPFGMPLHIRTEGISGNGLEVHVENRTDSPMTKQLLISSNQLPEDWKIDPNEHKMDVIPANGSVRFTFYLDTPSQAGAEQLGFQFQSDGLMMPWTVRVQPASIEEELIPASFELHGNYPNPFNPATTISYNLPETMQVSVEIFDIIGRRIAVLVNQQQAAGRHNVVWDASRAASGIYLYRLTAAGESGSKVFAEKTMSLIK